MLVAVVVDRDSLDIFHDKVGKAALGCATIEQARNVRMIKAGQNLALSTEMAQHRISVHAAFDQFDRDLLLILGIGALCQIDCAHSAAPDLSNDPIMINRRPGLEERAVFREIFFRKERIGVVQKSAGTAMRLEERVDFIPQLFITRASPLEKGGSFSGRNFERPFEYRLDLFPTFGSHAALPISR